MEQSHNKDKSPLDKETIKDDWEIYSPGIKATEENDQILSDKKNALFLSDILQNPKNEPFIDFEI